MHGEPVVHGHGPALHGCVLAGGAVEDVAMHAVASTTCRSPLTTRHHTGRTCAPCPHVSGVTPSAARHWLQDPTAHATVLVGHGKRLQASTVAGGATPAFMHSVLDTGVELPVAASLRTHVGGDDTLTPSSSGLVVSVVLPTPRPSQGAEHALQSLAGSHHRDGHGCVLQPSWNGGSSRPRQCCGGTTTPNDVAQERDRVETPVPQGRLHAPQGPGTHSWRCCGDGDGSADGVDDTVLVAAPLLLADSECDGVGDGDDVDDTVHEAVPERVWDVDMDTVAEYEMDGGTDDDRLGDGVGHTTLPGPEYWLVGQLPLHDAVDRPGRLPYCPALQLVHTSVPPREYCPTGQMVAFAVVDCAGQA